MSKLTGTVLRKTAAGSSEVKARSLGLARKTFSLLLAVDGRRTLEQMCETLSAYGDVAAQLAELHERGLIEAIVAGPDSGASGTGETLVAPFTRTVMPTRAGPQTKMGPQTRLGQQAEPGPQTTVGPLTGMAPEQARSPTARSFAGQASQPPANAKPAQGDPPVSGRASGSPGMGTSLGVADLPLPPSEDAAGRPSLRLGEARKAEQKPEDDPSEYRNLIDIRQYMAPEPNGDPVTAVREAMARSLGRSIDIETVDLLDSIERISSAGELAAVLPSYFMVIATRLSPAEHRQHVEQLAALAGISVEDLLAARVTELRPRGRIR